MQRTSFLSQKELALPFSELSFHINYFPPLTETCYRNMTWGGAQGFQTPIEPESFTVENFGVFGNEHSERGLTCEWHNLNQIK